MSAPSALPMPPAAQPRRLRPHTLRGKGLLALAGAIAYALIVIAYLAAARGDLAGDLVSLERVHRYERLLAKAEVAVSNASLEVQEATFAPMLAGLGPSRGVALAVEGAERAIEELTELNPGAERSVRAIARARRSLEAGPARAGWIDLRDALRRVQEEVTIERDRTALDRIMLTEGYQSHLDRAAQTSLLLLAGGVVAFGALVIVFFTRMTRDIERLQVRASEIVRGEHGPPLAVTRTDELGRLTRAVNTMADDLRSRAHQLELEQQRGAHQEKMATLGALAASVAHEINNPLMSIGGVAQDLAACEHGLSGSEAARRGHQLLTDVHRLANVTRQISDVAAPRQADVAWLDLNGLVRPLLQFVRYDKRYRGVEFVLDLDPQLPAAQALTDPVQLVVLRLLNEAAAAVVAGGRTGGRVEIRTRCLPARDDEPPRIALSIVAGSADSPARQQPPFDHAIDVCRSIIASLGGHLEIRRAGSDAIAITLALDAQDAAALAH